METNYYVGAEVVTRRGKHGTVAEVGDGQVRVVFSSRYPDGLWLRNGQVVFASALPSAWGQDTRKHY